MEANYPKVLIIGQQFDKKTGAGITLTNLFQGWDKNNLAVATSEICNPDFSVCEKYYIIGDKEIERIFPFNLKFSGEPTKSGILDNKNGQKDIIPSQMHTLGKLTALKDKILFITGQIHRRRRFVVSNEFLQWINEFSPDVIYTQLASLELIRYISMLQSHLNKPLVLHMMDDWPSTITNNQLSVFRAYWTQLINREFRLLINKANVLMSISESMSDEYLERYGRVFLPFHNPIDIKCWTPIIKKDYSRKDSFKILYAGRIGNGIQNCLLEAASAIKNQVNRGLRIEFLIQATTDHPVLKELMKFEFVTLCHPVPYNQLPGIFSAADLLLLPNDFDKSAISFLKFSMPTKASEYMVSGTPILVFSAAETAVAKHAKKYKWAYVVSENSREKLEAAISTLYSDTDLRRSLGGRAKEFAVLHYERLKITGIFRSVIQSLVLRADFR